MLNRPKSSIQDDAIWHNAPDTLEVHVRKPRAIPDADDSLEFHAVAGLIV
jgi:hypothetical protein